MDKLRSLTFFIATCDGGSFAEAARACNTDPSTVSKAIGRLEADLGVTLFQRSTRQLQPTEAGMRYAVTARSLVHDLANCEDDLKQMNDSPSGTLRISSAVCYGHLYIAPLLPVFCDRYPDIRLQLELDDLHADIIESHIDVAIRTGYVKDSRLVARRLSPMDFLTCASPAYLEALGTPRTHADFQTHRWIGFRIKETRQLQPVFLPDDAGSYQPANLLRDHITDDGEAMAQMCIDGLGIAQLPHFLAKGPLEAGKLVSLYPSLLLPEPESGVFAIYPKREFLPARVRVFIDFLVESLANADEHPMRTWAATHPSIIRFNDSGE